VSNHARRPRVFGPKDLFPSTTPLSAGEKRNLAKLGRALMKLKHDCRIEDIGFRTFAVVCSCGFEAAAPFGERQAERIREQHYARWHVIPDPMGAKYRA